MRQWMMSLLALLLAVSAARAERFVLVSSWLSKDVRRYTLDGRFVDTFIPAGTAGLDLPDGLTVGPDGDVYVADANHARILRFNGLDGTFKSVFASTPIVRAGYSQFGPDGNLYVCSAGGDAQVHRFAPDGSYLGAFLPNDNNIAFPAGIAWKGGTMYVSGFGGNTVNRYDAATGAFIGLLPLTVNGPLYIRASDNGDLYISEFGINRVTRFNTVTNRLVARYGGLAGGGATPLAGPVGQLVLPNGDLLVTSWRDGRVVRMNESTGAMLGNFLTGYPQANDLALTLDVPGPGVIAFAGGAGAVAAGRRRRR